ncbi:Na+/H+ antiporter subunit D [Polyangium aurulentum]|uniref:Na+/H+ antiporter subunit D n=1 Tax=Polyangium aurulentum TaxID=2567896 RepID=UPI0010ADFABF|nr:Na+/H+ antiporter subunit D [Polyangium aurulentum]UQA54800.1 Na+/H+ antiporter subunit D [Polyangium aurulentum]
MKVLLVLPVLVPMATAALTLLAFRREGIQRGLGLAGSVVQLVVGAVLLRAVYRGGIPSTQVGSWPWPYGITFVADTFSALMVLLSAIIAVATSIYALSDIDQERRTHGFYPLMHVLLMGTNGVFVTGDFFNLYVWFEVTLIASFVLLVLGNERPQMQGAIKYVAMNLISSALFLTGIGILYGSVHALNMADLSLKLPTLAAPIRTTLAMIFLVAFGIKAAVFPLFFWLPDSYHTPPVTITALFAGLLTKVGVYALVRVFTLLFVSDRDSTHALLLGIAGFTMAVGVLGAVSHREVRRILAFHSVSQVGYMVMGLGLFTMASLAGAIFFVLHHALIKSNLFLISGIMHPHGKEVRLDREGGLLARKPALSACFLVTALSLAGLPPLSGFWAKLLLVRSGLEVGSQRAAAVVATSLVVGLVTLISMTKIWNEAFWKPAPAETDLAAQPNGTRPRVFLYVPVVLLTSLGVTLGFSPDPLLQIVQRAAAQLADPTEYVHAVLGDRAHETPRP